MAPKPSIYPPPPPPILDTASFSNIAEKIAAYESRREQIACLKAQEKNLGEEAERLEKEIIVDMADLAEASGLTLGSLKLEIDGRNYSASVKEFFAIRAADRVKGFAALRAAGLGDLITERVDDRTLTNAIREEIKQNGGEMPEHLDDIPLSTYKKTTLSSRAAGRKG